MKVLIIGGGTTGFDLAQLLITHGIPVHILESNKSICEDISEQTSARVFCGDAKIPHHLEEARIEETDVVIAVTENESTNVLVGTLAKVYSNVKRILVRVRDPTYIEACQKLGITEIIDPAQITAQTILAHLRGFELVEAIEQIIKYADVVTIEINNQSPHYHKRINEIKFPTGNHLIAILRNDSVEIPEDNIKLKENDKLIFIHKKSLKESLSKFLGA